eukprot:14615881-Alexandrium_andersonii.AAC.1
MIAQDQWAGSTRVRAGRRPENVLLNGELGVEPFLFLAKHSIGNGRSGGCKGAATKGQRRSKQFSAALGRFKQF